MTLMEVLKSGKWYRSLRVVNGSRQMVWDNINDAWIVCGPRIGNIFDLDEELAIKYLLYEEEVPATRNTPSRDSMP